MEENVNEVTQTTEEVTVVEKTQKEIVLEKISNKEQITFEDVQVIKDEYVKVANQISNHVGENWFKIGKMSRLMNIPQADCLSVLVTLVQLELVVAKVKANHNEFKVDIKKEDLKLILEKELETKKREVEFLENRLSKL